METCESPEAVYIGGRQSHRGLIGTIEHFDENRQEVKFTPVGNEHGWIFCDNRSVWLGEYNDNTYDLINQWHDKG